MENLKKVIFLVLILLFCVNVLVASDLKDEIKSRIDKIEIQPKYKVSLISMLPIFELRGAIPIGINYYKLPWLQTFIFAIFGNMIPIFFILLFFRFIETFFRRFKSTEVILEINTIYFFRSIDSRNCCYNLKCDGLVGCDYRSFCSLYVRFVENNTINKGKEI